MLMREDQGCFDRLQERVNFYMTKNFTFKLRCLYVRQMRADSARLLSNIKSAMIPLNAGGKKRGLFSTSILGGLEDLSGSYSSFSVQLSPLHLDDEIILLKNITYKIFKNMIFLPTSNKVYSDLIFSYLHIYHNSVLEIIGS